MAAKVERDGGDAVKRKAPRQLLRKPRMPAAIPAELPRPPSPETRSISTPFSYVEGSEFTRFSPHPSLYPSVVSPPPPSELISRPLFSRKDLPSSYSRRTYSSVIRKGDLKYVLDPVVRNRTEIGTYVEGQSLLKPYKPRGPDGLPLRPVARQHPQILHEYTDEPLQQEEFPQQTLQDCMVHIADIHHVPLVRVQQVMLSKHNYKQFQCLLSNALHPKQEVIKSMQLMPSDDMPSVTPRVPQKQLLLEMAALVKDQMSNEMQVDMKTVIRKLPKYSPDYKPGSAPPHTEILIYEDSSNVQRENLKQYNRATELPSRDSVVHSSSAKYFQGARRSNSPFAPANAEEISPGEVAMLDCLMNGGYALSLKAMFVSQLPDVEPLIHTVTYINLSFNNFQWIPPELFMLEQLTVLKLRNNPLHYIPVEIARLKNLKVLVLSYCLLSTLPLSLFSLEMLLHLDVAYNKLTFLPSEIQQLRNLREFNVEGNQLPAMPKKKKVPTATLR